MLEVDKLLMHGTAIPFQVNQNLYAFPPPLYCIVSITLGIHQQEQTLSVGHLQSAIKCGPSVRYLTTLLLIRILIPPPPPLSFIHLQIETAAFESLPTICMHVSKLNLSMPSYILHFSRKGSS